jgi:hypothetical protein
MSSTFKKMVLMPFDAIKNKRNLAKGYEKLPSSKSKTHTPDDSIMEMTASTSKLVHKPKKSKKHKKKLPGKWKIFN